MSRNAKSDKSLRKPPRSKPWVYGLMNPRHFEIVSTIINSDTYRGEPLEGEFKGTQDEVVAELIRRKFINDQSYKEFVIYRMRKHNGAWRMELVNI